MPGVVSYFFFFYFRANNLSHQFGLNLIARAYHAYALHLRYAAAYRGYQAAMKYDGIAGYHLILEPCVLDLQEQRDIVFGVRHGVQYQDTAGLRHRLDLQHTREQRLSREVTREQLLIHGHILQTHHMALTDLQYLIHHQHWLAMR